MKDAKALQDCTHALVEYAHTLGVSAFEMGIIQDQGFSLSVREGNIDEQISHQGVCVSMSAYQGQQVASVSVSTLSIEALKAHCKQACQMAKHTEPDPCAGLAPKEQMATDFIDDDLYHPSDLTLPDAYQMAIAMEQQITALDQVLSVDSIDVSVDASMSVYANSHGFTGITHKTMHSLYACAMAEERRLKHRDTAYSVARAFDDLVDSDALAQLAGRRALARLGAQSLSPRQASVLFTPRVARSLIGSYLSAIRGGALYRKASFLLDCEGEVVFHPSISILDDPHIARGLGSKSFDADGVAPQKRFLVEKGRLQGALLGAYSARQLGRRSTGNGGGYHNILVLSPDAMPYDALLARMGTGLVVTELIGSGVDLVSGEVSWGAFGFWVERGRVQHPVHEITLAGSLQSMAQGCIGVGNDIDYNSSIRTGSLLIDAMTIAGA